MSESEILLNQIAQDKRTLEEGIEWFDNLSDELQNSALDNLLFFTMQAFPSQESIDRALQDIPTEENTTPAVIYKKNTLTTALQKIQKLPKTERKNAFVVTLSIFRAADTHRRETHCKNGCQHEWHNLKD
ncbi:MAG: DUF5958 family protein [Cytophagales bacterium]|jgi:hypothetical protein|nr:DUF5958 family protein [Cytophagales bacterium]